MAPADNVDEEFETYSFLPFYVLGFVRVALAVFGVITNIMSIKVLSDKSIWSATSILLISLVVYDTFFLMATATSVVTGLLTSIDDTTYLRLASVLFPVRFVMQVGSHYSTVALTVERFIVVVKPFKAKVIWTMSNARRVILAVFVFTIVFNIPRFIVYSSIPSSNMTDDEPILSDVDVHFWYTRVYEIYLTLVIFYIVPYAVIMTLNIWLLLQLRKSSKKTRKLSARSPSQHGDGLTIIVLGLTSCFFVCCVIPMAWLIMMVLSPTLFSEPSKVYLQPVSDTMLCINSATNFIFYCLLGRRFREIFCIQFCCRETPPTQRAGTGTSMGVSPCRSRSASVELLNKNGTTVDRS